MSIINNLKTELGKLEDSTLGKTLEELNAVYIDGSDSKIEKIVISLPGPLHNDSIQLMDLINSKV